MSIAGEINTEVHFLKHDNIVSAALTLLGSIGCILPLWLANADLEPLLPLPSV